MSFNVIIMNGFRASVLQARQLKFREVNFAQIIIRASDTSDWIRMTPEWIPFKSCAKLLPFPAPKRKRKEVQKASWFYYTSGSQSWLPMRATCEVVGKIRKYRVHLKSIKSLEGWIQMLHSRNNPQLLRWFQLTANFATATCSAPEIDQQSG